MKAYVLCIAVTLLLNLLAELFFKKRYNLFGMLCLAFSLIIACTIAGMRNITVGTDVRGYVVRLVNLANASPNFLFYIQNANSDFLFSILVYLGYLTKNINFLLFTIELAIALPIYIYAYKEKEQTSLSLIILIFFLNMFCLSLSMMRQSIAISLCVLSFHYVKCNNYAKGLIIVLLAVLFHKSAVIFLLFLIALKYLFKNNNYILFVPFVFLVMVIIIPLLDKVVSLSYYSSYLSNDKFTRDFSIGSILKKLFFLFLWLICFEKKSNRCYKIKTILGFVISFISLYCTVLSFYIPGMGRMGYYFSNLNNFMIVDCFPKKFKQKKFVCICLTIIYTLLWWNMTFVPNDPAGVYPYRSDIIKFLN